MFIELLVVLAIILFIAFKAYKSYFKNPPVDKDTQRAVSEQGIDTTTYRSALDSTRDKLKDIRQKHADELGLELK